VGTGSVHCTSTVKVWPEPTWAEVNKAASAIRHCRPGTHRDADEWGGSCAVYNRRKPPPCGKVGDLRPTKVKEPFEVWGVDLTELPESTMGSKCLPAVTECT